MNYEDAVKILYQNFKIRLGVIVKRDKNYKITREESNAIDYLFNEWDFTYEGLGCTQ